VKPDLELVEPTEALEATYRSYVSEFTERGESLIPFVLQYGARDFGATVRRLRHEANGVGLPDGYVPVFCFWLIEKQVIVGVGHLRHSLTPALAYEGGHIGYSIRPTLRNQGYATVLLRMVLERAKAMGIIKVLVTCDRLNAASARVIQKNGGALDSEVPRKDGTGVTQRYWIKM